MEDICEPNDKFDFDKLVLTKPIMITGGNFFIRFLNNDTPLYIQPPKCILKQGIIKAGKKIYCDLMFSNEDDSFIRWVENLENTSQLGIFNNREKWFETELEMHDIENSFTSTLKIFKSGKNYILRVNVPNVLGKCTLKVYDEDENEIDIENITDTTDIMSILEFKGIKCSARSFQIDIEIKQLMILKPKKLFEKCIFKTNKHVESYVKTDDHSTEITNILETIDTSKVNDISVNENINSLLENDIKEENSVEEKKDDEINNDNIHLEDNSSEKTINELENTICESKDNLKLLSDIDNVDSSIEKKELDTLEEININLDLDNIDNYDVVQLKKRNDVYYEMYKEALNKAKTARDLALSNYLEAKRIKNTYLLIDDETENYEDDLNF